VNLARATLGGAVVSPEPSTRLENVTVLKAGPEFPGLTLAMGEIWADGEA
jgi:hypothetical protein